MALVPLFLAACAGSSPLDSPPSSSATSSGVRGAATVDVGCPVLEGDSPCPRTPLRARITVHPRGSEHQIAATETDDDGRFEIGLTAGDYDVRGVNLTGQPVPRAMPVQIQVQPGQYTEIDIEFDSGIRGAPAGT